MTSCQYLPSQKSFQLLQLSCKVCICFHLAVRGCPASHLLQRQTSQYLLLRFLLAFTAQSWLLELIARLVSLGSASKQQATELDGLLSLLVHAGGLVPPCSQCVQDNIAGCSHCVPAMPTDAHSCCSMCGSSWDDGDPVLQDWCIHRKALLVSRQSSQWVSVYYRPCSDRLARLPCVFMTALL